MEFQEQTNLEPKHPSLLVDEAHLEEQVGHMEETAVGDFPYHRAEKHHGCCTVMHKRNVLFLEPRTRSDEDCRETGEEHQESRRWLDSIHGTNIHPAMRMRHTLNFQGCLTL